MVMLMSKNFTDWGSELYHYGVKGQKWGVRNYQNPDGTLTAAGQRQYAKKKDYRYGAGLYEIQTRSRLLDSDRAHKLGSRDLKENRVAYYESRLDRYRTKSPSKINKMIVSQTKKKLAAQKAANKSRELYDDRTRTSQIWVQNKLLGTNAAERYRDARARGDSRARSFVEGVLSKTPIGVIMRRRGSRRAYGASVTW